MTPPIKPGYPRCTLDRPTLQQIANALNLGPKLRDQLGWTSRYRSSPAKSLRNGGESHIVLHFNPRGQQIATSHRLVHPDGRPTGHWHLKDLLLSGTKFIDAGSD